MFDRIFRKTLDDLNVPYEIRRLSFDVPGFFTGKFVDQVSLYKKERKGEGEGYFYIAKFIPPDSSILSRHGVMRRGE